MQSVVASKLRTRHETNSPESVVSPTSAQESSDWISVHDTEQCTEGEALENTDFQLSEEDLLEIEQAIKEIPVFSDNETLQEDARNGLIACIGQFKSSINNLVSSLAQRAPSLATQPPTSSQVHPLGINPTHPLEELSTRVRFSFAPSDSHAAAHASGNANAQYPIGLHDDASEGSALNYRASEGWVIPATLSETGPQCDTPAVSAHDAMSRLGPPPTSTQEPQILTPAVSQARTTTTSLPTETTDAVLPSAPAPGELTTPSLVSDTTAPATSTTAPSETTPPLATIHAHPPAALPQTTAPANSSPSRTRTAAPVPTVTQHNTPPSPPRSPNRLAQQAGRAITWLRTHSPIGPVLRRVASMVRAAVEALANLAKGLCAWVRQVVSPLLTRWSVREVRRSLARLKATSVPVPQLAPPLL